MRCKNFSGPLGIYCGPAGGEELSLAAGILASYGKGKDEEIVEVITVHDGVEKSISMTPTPRKISQEYILR